MKRGGDTVVSKCSGNDHYPRGRGVNNVRLESSNFSDDSRTEGQRQRNLLIPGAREAEIKSKRVGHCYYYWWY